ncbi:glycosyltransferase family 4 protein [Nostoc sp. UHCC 0702]|nr:glycosyltransferase family 4 protein [Nostoc sp. UHCC 0702]
MNTVPKTIWHVGGEDIRFRIPLLLALRDKGFNVGAVGSENGDAFAKYQIPYFQYTLSREINPLADIQARTQLFHLFSKYKPDVVHGFDTKPAMITPIVAMKARIPGRVRTINGMGYIFSSNSPLALTLRPIYRHLQTKASAAAGITVFQNNDDREYFRKHKMVKDGCDDLVLGSGIDTEELSKNRPSPENLAAIRQELGLEGQLIVTMIARLVVSKGVMEYLDAARIVCQQMQNVKFILIGPFSSEGRQAVPIKAVQQQAEFVSYLGIRNDIPTLLALSDIFVLPSYREGMSRVLLEAGAMELPLITTNTPGCKDVVQDNWNGLLVPPKNAKSLATAILQLLKFQDKRVLMGTRSGMYVRENFSLKKVADSYTNIYYRALGLLNSEQVQLNKSQS